MWAALVVVCLCVCAVVLVLVMCSDDDVVSVQVSADDATLCKILSKAGEIISNCWLQLKVLTKTVLNTLQDLRIRLFNCSFDLFI